MLSALRITSQALIAAAALGLLASCAPTGGSESGTATLPPVRQTQPTLRPGEVDPSKPVTVALLVPLSGLNQGAATAGNALANAARMAMVDLADPTMQLEIYDTRGDAQTARAMAERAVADGAALILGPLFGGNTVGVGEVAARNGLSVISFSTDSSVGGGPVFVSGFLPESEAERIIGFAAARGAGQIAVYYPQTEYGRAAMAGAERAANRRGALIVTASSYPRTFQGIQDTSEPFASDALGFGASAVLLPDSGQGLRSVAAFLDYNGLDPAEVRYIGLGQWNGSETLKEAALQGGWFPAPDPDRLDRFSGFYAARHGASPPFIAVLGYDAVQIAGQLLSDARQVGSRQPFLRSEIARPRGFQGTLGPIAFLPDGTNRRAMAVLQVAPGRFEVLDPAPSFLGSGS